MAKVMCRDKRSVDFLVLCHNKRDRKVSAKSVTMRATALCKNLSGYTELLLILLCSVTIKAFVIFDRKIVLYKFSIILCSSNSLLCYFLSFYLY